MYIIYFNNKLYAYSLWESFFIIYKYVGVSFYGWSKWYVIYLFIFNNNLDNYFYCPENFEDKKIDDRLLKELCAEVNSDASFYVL